MAIDPYEPELAKRKKSIEIAIAQLHQQMHKLRNHGEVGYRAQMEQVDEALKDYRQAGFALADWFEQKPEKKWATTLAAVAAH